MADFAHRKTDILLADMEKVIAEIYTLASRELNEKVIAYFAKFLKRDEEMRKMTENGEVSELDYQQWRLAQIGRGERFQTLRDDYAKRVNEANQAAVAYINDNTPGVYSLNRNYVAYTIERMCGDVGFSLYDEQTVRRLIVDKPDLFPAPRVDIPVDLRWNKQKLTAELTSGILQGESISRLADRFQKVTDMNRTSAVRNARTAVTGAQNAGRQASYDSAQEIGLPLRKRWIATKDGRTRHNHRRADGQTVALNEPFAVGGDKLMYPGDTSGSPENIYNCRCTIRTVEKEGVEAEPRMMRVKDPVTGRYELVNEMTYDEWELWKMGAISASAKNTAADTRDNLNLITKRSTIRLENGFAVFPDDDPLKKYIHSVKPEAGYFDVALHGSPTAVAFGARETNMSPRLLASIIRRSEGYNGQAIRLLSCSTGKCKGDEYCFAEELANALGSEVKAPNDTLYINSDGSFVIGFGGTGKLITFKPNQRRRFK